MHNTQATAVAHANIALIKYWGKRDDKLNLPATGSLSLTLDGLTTTTSVSFDSDLNHDCIKLNNQHPGESAADRISAFLNLVYQQVKSTNQQRPYAQVNSHNNFPTAAGLASSASGFAALALATGKALQASLEPGQLSMLARRGSGSAARSIFGGIVEMAHGQRKDGLDSIATQLHQPDYWNLKVLIAVTDAGSKKISSTDGMRQTMQTSPYYPAWIAGAQADIETARDAIAAKDFETLANVTEFSTLKMHASALAAQPGVIYWNAASLAAMHSIRDLRAAGLPVCFTMDAGPQVKAVCTAGATSQVAECLQQVPGVVKVITCGLGRGVRLQPQ